MSLYDKRADRLVLPRWRDFKATSKTGELRKEIKVDSAPRTKLSCHKQYAQWQSDKSFVHSIELINSAYLSANFQLGREAALDFISHCPDPNHLLLPIAHQIAGLEQARQVCHEYSIEGLNEKMGRKINDLRGRLREYPRDPILCLDYARWLAVAGKIKLAERYVRTAIGLCPENVFVVRSAVRFFLHIHQFDAKGKDSLTYALHLVRKCPALRYDPWLMSTEIALCAYLEKRSNLINKGKALIESCDFSPFSLCELTSAIATEELSHGSVRKASGLFQKSLIDPNENTTAQAEWASSHVSIPALDRKVGNSYEASSYYNFSLEEWEKSFNDTLNWVMDQPFSREPVNRASYLACAIMDNPEAATKVCDFGLRANPTEFILLNNKAYSLFMQGKIEEGERTLNRIRPQSLNGEQKVAYLATNGLLHYSKGNVVLAELLYDQAQSTAKKFGSKDLSQKLEIFRTKARLTFNRMEHDPAQLIATLEANDDLIMTAENVKLIENVKKHVVTPQPIRV